MYTDELRCRGCGDKTLLARVRRDGMLELEGTIRCSEVITVEGNSFPVYRLSKHSKRYVRERLPHDLPDFSPTEHQGIDVLSTAYFVPEQIRAARPDDPPTVESRPNITLIEGPAVLLCWKKSHSNLVKFGTAGPVVMPMKELASASHRA